MKIKPLLVMDHDFYSLRPECVAFIFIIPPDPMNHVKIFKASPADLPFRSWYKVATKHFRLTILIRWKSTT